MKLSHNLRKQVIAERRADVLGEDVCDVIVGGHIHELSFFIVDDVPDPMVADTDVFSALLAHRVFGKGDCALVVTEDDSGVLGITNFRQ